MIDWLFITDYKHDSKDNTLIYRDI